jgi:hypothetical protein
VNIKKSILLRVRVAFLFVVLFCDRCCYQDRHIQFVEGEKWAAMGERISFDYKRVKRQEETYIPTTAAACYIASFLQSRIRRNSTER